MTTWGAFVVGVGQCVNWGVLYYTFAMLVPHLERELGVATWVITGAFSLALLASAGLAPTVGTWGDRGYAARIMEVGGFGAAILLAAWTLVPGVEGLYAVWTLAGLCMAMTLYEPAFVLVARAARDPQTAASNSPAPRTAEIPFGMSTAYSSNTGHAPDARGVRPSMSGPYSGLPPLPCRFG